MNPRIFVDSAASLERALHELIPISAHMGIGVTAYDGRQLTLSAPLANNINHQKSAFGGSLFSVAALAGWGILQLKMSELALDTNTVIADGDVSYRRPVFSDFTCTVELPDSWPRFVARLQESGKAGIDLAPTIHVDDKLAMKFSGNYVVMQVSGQ